MNRQALDNLSASSVQPPSLEAVVAELPSEPPWDPRLLFEPPGALEVEIGCGKGGFLLHRALTDPSARLLGIEWANKYFKYCADRMVRRQLSNVRVMRADAKELFLRFMPSACVGVLHVYHPDPWPKKRHHKRRLIAPDFVDAALRALRPEGRWFIQSDHAEYFCSIREQLDSRKALIEIPWDDGMGQAGEDWEGTNFEIKYRREGRDIHRVAYRRA